MQTCTPSLSLSLSLSHTHTHTHTRCRTDGSLDQSFMVDPLSYFSFQPVLHDWCNNGRGMCYPVVSFLSHVLQYTKLEHPLIGMVMQKCVFLKVANKDIIFCSVPSHVGIRGNEKADCYYVCFVCIVSRWVILNTILTNTVSPLGNMIGMARSRTSFILSSRSILGDWQFSYRQCIMV